MPVTEQRSTVAQENLQELLDCEVSPGQTLFQGAAQYLTPEWFARQCYNRLPTARTQTILDPQCGEGNLLTFSTHAAGYGVDIDNRLDPGSTNLITGNCVRIFETLAELFPDLRWDCANANPPFGKRWKLGDGGTIDSTDWTWKCVTRHANYGFFIANHNTIEQLGINKHPWVYSYETHQAASIWHGVSDSLVIGVAFWKRPKENSFSWRRSQTAELTSAWEKVKKILEQERYDRPPYNIYLARDGSLRTYLSVRSELQLKLSNPQIARLHRLNECHPLTLTTEKETRTLMRELVECGTYTIQPEALAAINQALAEVHSLACPIMDITDFERVAYADEEETLVCTRTVRTDAYQFTAGKRYALSTGNYRFTDKFTRNKVHFDESSYTTYTKVHECTLSGQDRFIRINDDRSIPIQFMDRPSKTNKWQQPESLLWEIFQQPTVKTLADAQPDAIALNEAVLRSCEMVAGYKYYPGQLKYLGRVAAKKSALIAAATGTGKSLMAISLIAMKCPERALIIAPQGTMRSTESMDDDGEESEEYNASQWVQELSRFAPHLTIYELFTRADYQRICSQHGGTLPPGVYVTYYQAMFMNGARESAPDTWNDTKLANYVKANFGLKLPEEPLPLDLDPDAKDEVDKRRWCDTIGREEDGIRCLIAPCMATDIGHLFDMVLLDEAHLCFPWQTLVTTDKGQLPIGEIVERKLDVRVLACNPVTRVTEWKRITGHFKNPATRKLVRVRHEHGSFICTDDHRIYTAEGPKAAASLQPGEALFALPQAFPDTEAWPENSSVLLNELQFEGQQCKTQASEAVSKGVTSSNGVSAVLETLPRLPAGRSCEAQILQQGVPDNWKAEAESNAPREVLRHEARLQEPGILNQDEDQQPDAKAGGCREDAPSAQRQDIPEPGRQLVYHVATGVAGVHAQLADGGSDTNRRSEWAVPLIADQLQGGHSRHGDQGGSGSGRELTPLSQVEVLGPQENRSLERSRVVSVEVLERGDTERLTRRGEEGAFVYCLEVEGHHNFLADGVLVSNCTNLNATVTQMLIRLQPEYRYALTATPIPNIVSNLFSLMGWLAVPNWYKGGIRNAAWPYSREELGRFNQTFLSVERDVTQEEENRRKDPKWKGSCVKESPVISAPARLLKLLKPTVAYISKQACNANYIPPEIIDVRVPMGKEQSMLYGYYLDRSRIPAKHPLVRARKQTAWLRNICADPAGFRHGNESTPKVSSNLNPKVIAILELCRDIFAEGEQVVIISSRVGLSNTLQDRLVEAGVSIARIDSTVTAEQHAYQANLFKLGKARTMLMGIKCAAAYSFDQCNREIISSIEYSPGSLNQAIGRIDRVTNKVRKKIFCILNANSIEEVMHDVVAVKDDAATICLKGQRVPREFKPVDGSEILAMSIDRFDITGATPERQCELQWPKLCAAIRASLNR